VQEARRPQEAMLLEFLGAYDSPCPVCGYNLRGLKRPVCPECRQDLVLAVGVKRLRLFWLLATLAPGFFSGIAAFFVFVMIVIHLVAIGSTWAIIVAVDSFGWCSGIVAVVIAWRRTRFLAQPVARQRLCAILMWVVHVGALAFFILTGFIFG
jgi:hypothetical protein